MAGHDPADPASLKAPVPDYADALTGDIRGMRIGVPQNFFFDRIDSEVAELVHAAIADLGRLGAELVDVTVPMTEAYGAIEGTISLSEGARVHAKMLRDTPERYGEDVRRILQLGSLIPAEAYLKAQEAKRLVIAAWRDMFEGIDLLAAPVLSGFAARVGQSSVIWPDGVEEPLFDATVRLCVPASLVGLPAISVPCGFGAAGLPTGLQLIGRPLADETVLRAAHAYEAATAFSPRWPVL
jgi:aspartyl-tRNA(Asn)/glutamyl-tRNA(Gln) amidotransferase subunit A